ncbi:hypothetical protein J437_LFUL005855 [Ladona fulva]|uniref:Thymidine phosphorylase n=1 Tax=Ladona fulva TaxID=123851 RepID=A0A8K0P3L6_LADFU|nr:hypothetical protein J437_LFUL005855 [Ladona fulva]
MVQENIPVNIVTLIEKKRDKKQLTHDEIQAFVNGVVDGTAQDCQIGAMLMAMMINELSDQETVSLTKCMINSGEVLDWPKEWAPLLVDKHSTGGVGDKISLPLAPALAACGAKVPMLSGRGLDITGGTLDKLESIPGYKVELTKDQMLKALKEVGCFIAGQTSTLVPADKEIYKRRDVTATVPSNGLVTGSILSKKAAEGVKSLILDLKVGTAAFYKSVETAEGLANKMIKIAKTLGINMRVALSRMDCPLGCNVGNALEVAESVYCMQGKGPDDLEKLVVDLGAHLLEMSGLAKSFKEGQENIHRSLHDGSALEKFCKMIQCQGVDREVAEKLCKDPFSVLLKVPSSQITTIKAKESGVLTHIDALAIGRCSRDLGAGRLTATQELDLRVGVRILAKPGQRIEKGSPWLEVHHATPKLPEKIHDILQDAATIGSREPNSKEMIIKVIQ